MNRYPKSLANHLSAYGRYGDDQLVHMNRQEVAALDGIAAAFGRELTRNPHTGMKEAFNLFDILPIALNFIPGIGTAASIALSAASGAASSAIEGGNPLEGALMGGLTGAVGASLGGGADAAAKAGTDAATKTATDVVSTAGLNVSPELLAEGVTAADIAGMASNAGQQFAAGATAAPTSILPGATNAATSAAASPGMFTDVFGAGTDKQVSDALQSIWKKENLPYTIMGGTALSMLPDMFASEGPEYKDIPENFPVNPRMVNPDYDPTMSAFGEQNAFSSGVDYLGRGFAQGGEVSKGNDFNPFNIQNMLGGVVPMIIDGFTDGNKYGSGILGMLLNKRKPWEYGKDDSPQGMANAPQMANSPSIPAPGYAYGGRVSRVPGYKGGGRVEYGEAPEGYMWQSTGSGERPTMRNIRDGKRGQTLVPDPNYRVQIPERNIQPTNIQGLYSGESPFINQGMTQIPLPGGQMGAPPQEQQSAPQFAPQDMSSFEIATPPGGGPQMYSMPTSGGGMGAPQAGGKAGGQGGGKAGGTPLEHISTPRGPSGGKAGRPETTFPGRPQQMGGGNGAAPVGQPNAMAQMLGAGTQGNQLYDRFMQTRDAERNNIAQMSGILRGIPTSKPEEQPQINPGLQTGIASTMGPGGAPGQASPVQPEPTQPAGPVGMGAQQGFAMGGMVGQAPQMDDRTLVKEAVAAIMGQSPNPEAAIAMFVERFGEEALQMLMQKVGGDTGMGQGRYLEGPGDGLSDSIPAVVDGQQPSALSSGEFVIPADAVSHLGNGDNKSGAKELYNMIDRLRQARTGSPTPPPAIDQRSVMPA